MKIISDTIRHLLVLSLAVGLCLGAAVTHVHEHEHADGHDHEHEHAHAGEAEHEPEPCGEEESCALCLALHECQMLLPSVPASVDSLTAESAEVVTLVARSVQRLSQGYIRARAPPA